MIAAVRTMNVFIPVIPADHSGRMLGADDAALEAGLRLAERFVDITITMAGTTESSAGIVTWARAAGADRGLIHASSQRDSAIPWWEWAAFIVTHEKPDIILLAAERDCDFDKLLPAIGMPIIPDVVAIDRIDAASADVTVRERGRFVTYTVALPAALAVSHASFPIRTVTVHQIAALDDICIVERVIDGPTIGDEEHEPVESSHGAPTCQIAADTSELASIIDSLLPRTVLQLEETAGRGERVMCVTSRPATDRPTLGTARIVVGGGRIFDDAAAFDRGVGALADVLGGAVAGTGAAALAGLLPATSVIGQSRVSVAPYLYIAAGISGADQHTGGVADARWVVAINNDTRAPIFDRADYGLVADIRSALPELTEKLGARRD